MEWDSREKHFQNCYLHPIFKLEDNAEGEKDVGESEDVVEASSTTVRIEEVPDSVLLTGSPVQVSHMGTQTSFSRQDAAPGTPGTSPLRDEDFKLKAKPPATISTTSSASQTTTVQTMSEAPFDVNLVATRRHHHSQGAIGHDGRTDCSCAYCLL